MKFKFEKCHVLKIRCFLLAISMQCLFLPIACKSSNRCFRTFVMRKRNTEHFYSLPKALLNDHELEVIFCFFDLLRNFSGALSLLWSCCAKTESCVSSSASFLQACATWLMMTSADDIC